MPLMISIIEKHCNSLSRRKADSKERVVEIIRRNPLKNKHLIFRIKTPRLFVFMANNTDNKFKDNTINKKVLV
jgi:hypothetical protein